jgi:hypothetical protein
MEEQFLNAELLCINNDMEHKKMISANKITELKF